MTKRVIRVVIPYHLQTLAQAGPEIAIEVDPPFTYTSLLDAIELRYPSLRGTIRDQVTKQRRPLLRYFACANDVSHESPSMMLPQAIISGDEPFIIWGAIAGG
jgi:sulfur-carrier protein